MFGFILHLIKIMPISDGLIQAIDPLTIGLAIGGVKALAGGIQALTAGPKVEQEKYKIPDEYKQAFQQSMELSRQGMDETSKQAAMQAAQQAALFRQRAAGQSRLGLANFASSESLLSRDLINIAAQDAAIRQRNRLIGIQALENLGRRKDIEFQTESQRRQNLELQRRARVGAGLQNIMGGLDIAGSIAAMGALGKTPGTQTLPTTTTTQIGRGIAGGPSISDYLSTSPFNTSARAVSTPATTIYNTSLNSYMPGTYGALMGTPSRNPFSTGISTPASSLPGYGAAMQDLFSNP